MMVLALHRLYCSAAASRHLLPAGAKVDARNSAGSTALDQALARGVGCRIWVLLAAGATIPSEALTQAMQSRYLGFNSW